MSTRIQFTTLALTAALSLAGAAEAFPAATPPAGTAPTSVRISVADLDLHNDAGANLALRRIHRAAVVICGDEPLSSGLARHALFEGCVKSSVRTALASSKTQLASVPGGRPLDIEMVLAASR